MEKNKIVKRLPKTETKIDIKPSIELKPIIKIDDGIIHNGETYLYKPDTEWNCGCLSGDKDLCVFLFKCGISSAVLGFCMVMLMNDNKDGFYISTISLILGGVMGNRLTILFFSIIYIIIIIIIRRRIKNNINPFQVLI